MTLQSSYDHLNRGGTLLLSNRVYHETLVLDPGKPVTIRGENPIAAARFYDDTLTPVDRPVIAPPAGSKYAIMVASGERADGFHFADFAIDTRWAVETIEAGVFLENINHTAYERLQGVGSFNDGPLNCPLIRVVRSPGRVDASWHTLRDCYCYGIPLARFGDPSQRVGHNSINIFGGGCNLLVRQPGGSNRGPWRGPSDLACVELLQGGATSGRVGLSMHGVRLENAMVGVHLVGQWSSYLQINAENLFKVGVDLEGCRDTVIESFWGGGYFPLAARESECRFTDYRGHQRHEVAGSP